MRLHAFLIFAPEGGYVSFNPETATTSQGETVEEAMVNLKEAVGLYLEQWSFSLRSVRRRNSLSRAQVVRRY